MRVPAGWWAGPRRAVRPGRRCRDEAPRAGTRGSGRGVRRRRPPSTTHRVRDPPAGRWCAARCRWRVRFRGLRGGRRRRRHSSRGNQWAWPSLPRPRCQAARSARRRCPATQRHSAPVRSSRQPMPPPIRGNLPSVCTVGKVPVSSSPASGRMGPWPLCRRAQRMRPDAPVCAGCGLSQRRCSVSPSSSSC